MGILGKSPGKKTFKLKSVPRTDNPSVQARVCSERSTPYPRSHSSHPVSQVGWLVDIGFEAQKCTGKTSDVGSI
jgi:hypothetical protein